MRDRITIATSVVICVVCVTFQTVAAQDQEKPKELPNPVLIEDGVVSISNENSTIGFVGTHVGDDPKPRTGGFGKFEGKLELDADGKTIKAIEVAIEIDSVWTEFGNLTRHLKTGDFFDASNFPTSEFRSKNIRPADGDGKIEIIGELTLLKTTAEVSFPAKLLVSERGLVLESEFTIDRTAFGMDRMQEGVENVVTVHVAVGHPTKLPSKQQ